MKKKEKIGAFIGFVLAGIWFILVGLGINLNPEKASTFQKVFDWYSFSVLVYILGELLYAIYVLLFDKRSNL